jgi:hypothetical protein
MKILPEIKNFKLNQTLEKILLISALSMLPSQPNLNQNLGNYNISTNQNKINSTYSNFSDLNKLNQKNIFQLNSNYNELNNSLNYKLTMPEINLQTDKLN